MKLIMFGITDPTMTSEEVKQILADSFGDSIGNVLEVVVHVLHNNACREVFDDFVQNLVELFDLLLMRA